MTDDGSKFWAHCAHCGAALDLDDWPPIVELVADGGESVINSYCDETCQSKWNADD